MTTKDLQAYPKYTVTGTGNSILANRISYFYNLHGPSATIDTACSSSLVCFHMGNQSIRNNESDISIVVGSALHFDPNIFITMTDLGMLSSDGRCRAFDASGSGYVRGEGVCAAILKRKSRADCDGDSIRAIVRGTAANHDGRKQGITLPSAEAQEELIRRTYRAARVNPADTQYCMLFSSLLSPLDMTVFSMILFEETECPELLTLVYTVHYEIQCHFQLFPLVLSDLHLRFRLPLFKS